MPTKKEEEKSEDYYKTSAGRYPETRNKHALAEWFESTEPDKEKPRHTKVMRSKKATIIILKMITLIGSDVLKNSIYSWEFGRLLPSKFKKRQPLGHATNLWKERNHGSHHSNTNRICTNHDS